MKPKVFYQEIAYVLGIAFLSFGTALMTKADLGMSVVVSPAYLLYRKLSLTVSFVTFGMAEYLVQGLLLGILILVMRRFYGFYLFSFVTALFYGFLLDRFMALVASIQAVSLLTRIPLFVAGLFLCALGIALVFRTYIAPEVYELFLKEISSKYHWKLSHCKTVFDCSCCLIAIALSFTFFGFFHFEGVKWGTAISALLNGTIIGGLDRLMDRFFLFSPAFPKLERYFKHPNVPSA